ncbi:MAG: hypothetical protein ACRDZ2_15800 [Ilumatobacteraceae bacterium]
MRRCAASWGAGLVHTAADVDQPADEAQVLGGQQPDLASTDGGQHELTEPARIDGGARPPVADHPPSSSDAQLALALGVRVSQRCGEP